MQRNRSAHTALGNHRSSHVNTLTTRNAKHQWTHRAILKSSKKLSLLTIWQNLTTTIGRVRASKIASAACPCPFPRSFTPLLIKLIFFLFIQSVFISFYRRNPFFSILPHYLQDNLILRIMAEITAYNLNQEC